MGEQLELGFRHRVLKNLFNLRIHFAFVFCVYVHRVVHFKVWHFITLIPVHMDFNNFLKMRLSLAIFWLINHTRKRTILKTSDQVHLCLGPWHGVTSLSEWNPKPFSWPVTPHRMCPSSHLTSSPPPRRPISSDHSSNVPSAEDPIPFSLPITLFPTNPLGSQ